MKKRLLGVLVMGLLTPTVGAASVGLGLQTVIPIGDYRNETDGGFGIDLGVYGKISDKALMSGNIGTIVFSRTSAEGGIQGLSVPLTLGYVHYLKSVKEKGLFLKAKGGVAVSFESALLPDGSEGTGVLKVGPTFSPGIGYSLGKFSASAEYNIRYTDWTWFSLTAAFRFGN